jgi:hypothetical protein
MWPLRTGAGKPIETTSNFHPVSLNFAIIFFGRISGPEAKSR